MTRLSVLFVAAIALAVTACERHPLPGESAVTFTHGSGGGEHAEAGASHEGEAKAGEKKAEEKKAEHAPGAATEEAPKFFPEKK